MRARAARALVLVALALTATAMAAGGGDGFELSTETRAPFGAPPPQPDAPVQLVLDDGTSEGVFGLTANSARPYLWFNRFDGQGAAIQLQEIQVLFPAGTDTSVGDAIDLAVYVDDDGDPTNGAEWIATVPETVQFTDGDTWSQYLIDPPIAVDGSADLLIGAIGRFAESGVQHQPSAFDNTDTGRAWFALWTGDAPFPPTLPADGTMGTLASVGGGTWMIRAFGSPVPASVVDIPVLDSFGLRILVLLLIIVGIVLARQNG